MAVRRRPKKKKPFPFFRLPRELRAKVYSFGINIKRSGFAPLFRLNRASYTEAEEALLREHSFILFRFSWPRIAQAKELIERTMSNPTERRNWKATGQEQIKLNGNMLVHGAAADHSVLLFKHYRMHIDIKDRARMSDAPSSYIMLYGRNLQKFTISLGTWHVPVWQEGPEARDLRYRLHFLPNVSTSLTLPSPALFLKPFFDNWWSFRNVQVTGNVNLDLARRVSTSIMADKWHSVDHFVDSVAVRYNEAMDHWRVSKVTTARHQLLRHLDLFTLASRASQVKGYEHLRLVAHAMKFHMVVPLIMCGVVSGRHLAPDVDLSGIHEAGVADRACRYMGTTGTHEWQVVARVHQYVLLKLLGRSDDAARIYANASALNEIERKIDLAILEQDIVAGWMQIRENVRETVDTKS